MIELDPSTLRETCLNGFYLFILIFLLQMSLPTSHRICTMLNWYIDKCMVSIININSSIKECTHGYQIVDANQRLILGGYLKVREFLFAHDIIWVHIIINPIETHGLVLSC